MSAGNWKEMLLAAEGGDLELVVYHIEQGVDPNYQHPEFLTTPLVESIRAGHLEVAEFLLKNGAVPSLKELFSQDTPMDIARRNKNHKAIYLLNNYLPIMNKKKINKVIVTGGNRGIGKAIAEQLLKESHKVVITVRDLAQGEKVAKALTAATNNPNITAIQGDLSSIASCYQLANNLKKEHPDCDTLINNAGVWMAEKIINEDGLEQSFMVNYMAPYILSRELFPLLKKNSPARIVNVNAGLYIKGQLDIEKTPKGLDFHSIKTYANTKLCNTIFTLQYAKEIAGSGVTINAVHPGVINTGLGDSPKLLSRLVKVIKRFWKPPAYGAIAPVWLATSEEVANSNGLFYNEKEIMPFTEYVLKEELQLALERYTKNQLASKH